MSLNAYWTFDGTAADSSGNNLTLSYSGGPSYTTDVNGNSNSALSFDGNNDYATRADNNLLDFGQSDFSISFWIKPDDNSGTNRIMTKRDGSAGFHFWASGTYFIMDLISAGGTDTVNWGSSSYSGTTWRLITVAVDRSANTAYMWVNKTSKGGRTLSYTTNGYNINNSGSFNIGTLYSSSTGKVSADFDDVRVYKNQLLTQTDVNSLYDNKFSTPVTVNAGINSSTFTAPTVIIPVNIDISPSTLDITSINNSVDISAGNVIESTINNGTINLLSPDIETNSAVIYAVPTEISSTLSIPEIDVNCDTVYPMPIALGTNITTPTASTSVAIDVSPAVISSTLSIPEESISTTVVIEEDTTVTTAAAQSATINTDQAFDTDENTINSSVPTHSVVIPKTVEAGIISAAFSVLDPGYVGVSADVTINVEHAGPPEGLIVDSNANDQAAKDYSGRNQHGTLNNVTTSQTNAHEGYCWVFDESDQVYYPTSAINESEDFSVSVWVKWDAYTAGELDTIISSQFTADQINFALTRMNTSHLRLHCRNTASTENLDEDTSFSFDTNWHHVVLTATSTNQLIVYWDGAEVLRINNANYRGTSSNIRFRLGQPFDPYWSSLNGRMDQLRIYNRIITSTEISELYNETPTDEAIKYTSATNDVTINTGTGTVFGVNVNTSSFTAITPTVSEGTGTIITPDAININSNASAATINEGTGVNVSVDANTGFMNVPEALANEGIDVPIDEPVSAIIEAQTASISTGTTNSTDENAFAVSVPSPIIVIDSVAEIAVITINFTVLEPQQKTTSTISPNPLNIGAAIIPVVDGWKPPTTIPPDILRGISAI